MNKQFYIESMHNNLHILFAMGVIQDEMYKCPLCMQSFSDDEVVKNLTEEDVPQASLGGKRIALTCRLHIPEHTRSISDGEFSRRIG